ncbi:probable cytochrome P450 6a23 isoform X2 [Sitophilus oryzae]|nr:probable cytochrome P450 6a23 isoform X2 [Sitophilus oryzae]
MPVDNEIIKRILVSDFIHFANHGVFVDKSSDPLSTHIFNMEGYRWKNIRSKLPIAFTAAKMRRNVIIMNEISKEFIKELDKEVNSNNSINIKDLLSRFTIDVVSSCSMGMKSNTLKHENETLVEQSTSFFEDQWSRTSNILVTLIPRKILVMLHFKLFNKRASNFFLNMFKQIKDHRLTETVKRNDLTDLLLDLCDGTKEHKDYAGDGTMEPLSFDEFAAQMYVFFEAAFETSSSTQTFALYELGANKEVQDRLRNEIEEVLKKHNGQVTYEAVCEMEYLERVIDETLRKYPVFPSLARICTKDYVVPGTDVTIEKDSFVMITNLGIHYDPEYYPDPMKFDPERFTAENKAKRPYCSYVPFGEGPRICLGKRFGLWQIKIGLISILRNYEVSLSDKMQLPLAFKKTGLILRAEGSVWLHLEKIN